MKDKRDKYHIKITPNGLFALINPNGRIVGFFRTIEDAFKYFPKPIVRKMHQ